MPNAVEAEARDAFETASHEHRPDFELFFLARLFGLEFNYPSDTRVICFPVPRLMFDPQGGLHGEVICFWPRQA